MSDESAEQIPSDSGTSNSGTSEVKTGEWLKSGLELYKTNFMLLFLSSLLVFVVSACSLFILAGPMAAGYYLLVLRLVDKSEPAPAIGDVFKGFSFFVPTLIFLVASVLIGFGVSALLGTVPWIGWLLSTLSSIFIGTSLMFGLPLMVDKGLDIIPAAKTSYERVSKDFLGFAVFAAVAGIAGMSGFILLFIGVFLTIPIVVCSVACAYRDSF